MLGLHAVEKTRSEGLNISDANLNEISVSDNFLTLLVNLGHLMPWFFDLFHQITMCVDDKVPDSNYIRNLIGVNIVNFPPIQTVQQFIQFTK